MVKLVEKDPAAMDKTDAHFELLVLPKLAPDETIFSLLARAHCLGGYENATATSRIVFGDDRAAMLFDFPRRLTALSAHLPEPLANPARLASDATCLPFFTRFRDRSVMERAIQKMCGQSVAALKDDLGLRACSSGPLSAVKACLDCIVEDTTRLGAAYWHRVHQLPGVTMCTLHRVPLVQSAPVRQGKQPRLFLPHELLWTRAHVQKHEAGTGDRSLSLADLASSALRSELPGGFSADALYHAYRHGLKASGFLSRGNRLRLASLQDYLDAYVSSLPTSVRLCRPELSRETQALVEILRARKGTFNTLPHLVLIDALFGSWSHFVAAYEWERAMCHDQDPIEGIATDCTSTKRYAEQRGAEKRSTWDRCSTTILGYMREHPDCSRSHLVKACGGSWRWLYRHDHAWLESNAPRPLPKRRAYVTWVNWEKRDAALLAVIARKDAVLTFSRRSRITPRTVLKALGQIPFSVRLEKMPKSATRLRSCCEIS
jgi:hypothetical protein